MWLSNKVNVTANIVIWKKNAISEDKTPSLSNTKLHEILYFTRI